MRNRKLYEAVEQLVKQRQVEKKSHKTFVEDFCHQQLSRKKLIPRDNSSKIDDIMRNFKDINTYINVDHLINCINRIHAEEIKNEQGSEEELKKIYQRFSKMDKHKRFISEGDEGEKEVLWKAQTLLKDYSGTHSQKDDQMMMKGIKVLEDSSTIFGDGIKNSSISSFYKIAKKNKFEQKPQNNKENQKQVWNFYENAVQNWQYIRKLENDNGGFSEWIKTSSNFTDLCKKRKKMFQLARIYLNMILEDEHRRKWHADKKNKNKKHFHHKKHESTLAMIALEKGSPVPAKATCFTNSRNNTQVRKNSIISRKPLRESKNQIKIKKQEKQKLGLRIQSCKRENVDMDGNPKIERHRKNLPSQNYEREQAIKKMNNFLEELEEDENTLKREKVIDTLKLDKYENRIQNESMKVRKSVLWNDEQKIKEIQAALSRQDKPKKIGRRLK